MTAVKELFKEFREINRKNTFLDQASFEFPNGEEDPFTIDVYLTPNSGAWKGSKVNFRLQLPSEYPEAAPQVSCVSKVYHPNISFDGSVCFSMFDDEWSNSYRLDHYINGLLWLLGHPNPSSALNSNCIPNGPFKTAVQLAIHGCPVQGIDYPCIASKLTGPDLVAFMYDHYIAMAKGSPDLGSIRGHFYNIQSPQLPGFLKQMSSYGMKGRLIKVGKMKRLHKVKKVAEKMKKSPQYFVKELLFKVGNDLVLVLTNGVNKVDVAELALLCNAQPNDCSLAPVEAMQNLGWSQYSLPAFGHGDSVTKTIVNFDLFNMDSADLIYTASGVPHYLIELTAGEFKRMMSAAVPSNKLLISDKINLNQVPATVTFSFSIHYRTEYGEQLALVGSIPELGNWNVEKPLFLQWNDGDLWTCNLSLNKLSYMNQSFQYKYLVKRDGVTEPIRWEAIPNRSQSIPVSTPRTFVSCDKWDIIYCK